MATTDKITDAIYEIRIDRRDGNGLCGEGSCGSAWDAEDRDSQYAPFEHATEARDALELLANEYWWCDWVLLQNGAEIERLVGDD